MDLRYYCRNAGNCGKENDTLIVAIISDPDGSETTDELRNQTHTVRCVKSRY